MTELDLAERMQAAIYALIRQAESIEQDYLAERGVTLNQAYALLAFGADEQVTMSELSERMQLAKSTLTRKADHLVKKGLVERVNSAEDRRVVQLQLTEQGRLMRAAFQAEFRSFFEEVLNDMPKGEQSASVEALERSVNVIHGLMARKKKDEA